MREEKGSITLWVLGLSILILGFGGIALDFWRALAVQRQVAAVADSAAIAAASGIDEAHYRTTGEVRLDQTRAVSLGQGSIGSQSLDPVSVQISVAPDGSQVDVEILDNVSVGLLGFFIRDDDDLMVRGTASAVPRLVP